MRKNRVLLTGGSGFLGKYIFEYLSKSGYKVDTLSRNATSTIISDISKILPRINTKYDLVVHSAGKAHTIPKTDKENKEFSIVNYEGTKNLCHALINRKPNTIVFISTIAVYGKNKGVKIIETENLDGETPYAKSKILAEQFLQEWCIENIVNLVILRLPLVAGKNPKGNLGAMITGIEKGYYFNISKSKALKSIVLADDIAKLIPGLAGKNGIYNLAGDKDYTFKEISGIIAYQLDGKKIKNLPYFLVNGLAKIGDMVSFFPINSVKLNKITSTLTISSEKAKKELNWKPKSLRNIFRVD